MANSTWLDEVYSKNYNDMRKSLEARFPEPGKEALEEISGLLSHYYVYEGNNWEGRGPVQDASIEATIHALEDFKASIEQRLKNNNDSHD